ncbi:MAG: hypothetical protein OXI30_03760 [Chloroflexota bacterium]|nr:hypothetical protein [Chloroflexota bacterium]
MFHVARMYSDDQWLFEQVNDVVKLFYSDEIHHNDAIVVEHNENGIRAWIGTDFVQTFENSVDIAGDDVEWWAEMEVVK